MTKIIEVIVSPTGDAKVETKGFAGAECRDASAFIEKAMGKQQRETLKAEYHRQRIQQTNREQA
ncbi:DUF2997 domain-containing protein [Roseiconus lacunae]|uniref:DUF2997 domain-containing protein n=1 Tax=Roseiconus lacunae TaxID=2605694 RepID=UPI001E4C684D|nr:DUF2997 domain-containing protein [Roseiconus lacunae]MCD0458624.1 DUF2997 domain-containing protein [Roseiconus lacunae]